MHNIITDYSVCITHTVIVNLLDCVISFLFPSTSYSLFPVLLVAVDFESPVYMVPEEGGDLSVCVELVALSPSLEANISVSSSSGTAIGNTTIIYNNYYCSSPFNRLDVTYSDKMIMHAIMSNPAR